MTGKNGLFCVLFILVITTTITVSSCKTNENKTIENNVSVNNTVIDNTVPNDGKSFPLSFRGTWKRDNFNTTIVFTQNTLKASNQSYTWNIQSVSGDVYKIKPSNYDAYSGTVVIKLNNGNLEISGDSAIDNEHNWNGIWKKQ